MHHVGSGQDRCAEPTHSPPRRARAFPGPPMVLACRRASVPGKRARVLLPNARFCRDDARSATRAVGPVGGSNLALGAGHRGRPRGWRGPSECRRPLTDSHLGAASWRHRTYNTLMLLILSRQRTRRCLGRPTPDALHENRSLRHGGSRRGARRSANASCPPKHVGPFDHLVSTHAWTEHPGWMVGTTNCKQVPSRRRHDAGREVRLVGGPCRLP